MFGRRPQEVTVEINATLQWVFFKDDASQRWIAVCDPLGLTIEAETHTELRENIEDGLNLLFLDLVRENEFEGYLRQRGWSVTGRHPAAGEKVRFDVPFELVSKGRRDSENRIH